MILVVLLPILIIVSIVIAILRFNRPNVKTSKTKLSSRVSIRLLMVYVVVLLVATVWTWAFPVSSEDVTALTSKEMNEKKKNYRLLTAGNAEEMDDSSIIETWSQPINDGVFKITSESAEQMPLNLVIKRTDDSESVVTASLYQSMVLYNQYEIQTNLDQVNIEWQNDTLEIGNQSPPETNLNLKFYDYEPINRKFQLEYNYGEFTEYLPVLYVEVPKSIKLYVDQRLGIIISE
jgi:3-methyladenine DNA glycosylase AlkC